MRRFSFNSHKPENSFDLLNLFFSFWTYYCLCLFYQKPQISLNLIIDRGDFSLAKNEKLKNENGKRKIISNKIFPLISRILLRKSNSTIEGKTSCHPLSIMFQLWQFLWYGYVYTNIKTCEFNHTFHRFPIKSDHFLLLHSKITAQPILDALFLHRQYRFFRRYNMYKPCLVHDFSNVITRTYAFILPDRWNAIYDCRCVFMDFIGDLLRSVSQNNKAVT